MTRVVSKSRSIRELISAIEKLPEDAPRGDSSVWYTTQKEHWLGWLREYGGPGAYGRPSKIRDAQFAYSHIMNDEMLDWLTEAAGVDRARLRAARRAVVGVSSTSPASRVAAFSRVLSWNEVAKALWPA